MKNNLRSTVGLTASMTIIATLLSACGGGGGGGVAPPASSSLTLTATPALGAFVDGATVIVSDYLGKECSRGKTLAGTANITINPTTCIAPLVVQAGIPGDLYFNEATGANQPVTGTGVHAVLPNTTVASFGVSALTEIAAFGLLNTTGGVNTNAAGVSARNNAIASLLTNGNVTDPLAVPHAAASLTAPATDAYGAMLAMLAHLGTPGQTPEAIARDFALDLADGTWDGLASGVLVSTPTPTTFGAAMLAAEGAAVVNINAVSAATIPFSAAYLPDSGITAAVAATAANGGTAPTSPINTAKNLFTSLRTSLNLLTNPSRTGFFDTEILAARNDLSNAVMPALTSTFNKVDALNSAVLLMNDLKANGIAAIPACSMSFGTCQYADPAIVANVIVSTHKFNPNNGRWNSCETSIPGSFTVGSLPALVSCYTDAAQPSFSASSQTYYTFKADVMPGATANNYTYTSSTTTQTIDFMGMPVGAATNSANYIGTASVVKTGLTNSSIAVTGQLAADGVSHAYDQVAINTLRTYTATVPAGAPAGFALARYDATGSIGSGSPTGVTTGTISLLTGSSFSQLEDVNGAIPVTRAAADLGRTLTAVVQAKTAGTQIDGTLTGSNVACALSGLGCSPTNLSFTGSITDLANAAVGKFFTGTLADIRDYSAYDNTQPVTSTNRIKIKGTLTGTVTNNTVAPAAVYQLTLNEDMTVDNQNTVSLIYKDSLNNTVNVNSVILANTPTHTFNVTSGTVVGVLTRTPVVGGTGGTNGLTGNLYVGGTFAAPGTLIGTLSGAIVNYTDGTFTSLQ